MTSSREPLRQRAFTLIEVLVVIGVMAVVATLVGIGLSRGGVGAALKASQSLLVSQLNAARSQAALGESRTALVVVADVGSLERDRRFLAVAVEEGGGVARHPRRHDVASSHYGARHCSDGFIAESNSGGGPWSG